MYASTANLPITRCASCTAAAVSAAYFAAATAWAVAISNSRFARKNKSRAVFAFAVNCFNVRFAAANFFAAASATAFFASSAFFAASISASVGFGFATAGVDATQSPATSARLIKRYRRRIEEE